MARVHAGPVSAPVFPLILIGAGGYLTWFGVHYWRSSTVKWPSDPVKSVLQGKGIPSQSAFTPEQAFLALYTGAAGGSSAGAAASSASAQVSPSSAPSAAGGGKTLSRSQIEALWTGNGGPADTAAFAAAIAKAESGGRTAVESHNPDGGINVGLYQLDTRGVGSGYSINQLADPVTNTRITVMATRGGVDWTYWGNPVAAAVGHHYTPGSPVP